MLALLLSTKVPCVGYVVEEQSRPGRLRNEIVEPIVRRNVKALKEHGFKIPMKAMAIIKNLEVGSSFTFPDGTVLSQEEAVEPPREGRKIVVCGDTADCRAIEGKGSLGVWVGDITWRKRKMHIQCPLLHVALTSNDFQL